jgi:hypothetical protein
LEFDQYATDRPLEFLKKTHIEMKQQCCHFLDFKGNPKNILYELAEKQSEGTIPTYHTTPSKMIKFLPESVIEDLSIFLDRIFIKETDTALEIDIPNIIKTSQGLFEDVGDLNGIAIPCMYYDVLDNEWNTKNGILEKTNQNRVLYDIIGSKLTDMKETDHGFLRGLYRSIEPDMMKTPADYLYMANMYVSVSERLYYKIKQISKNEYSWLSEDMITKSMDRLNESIGVDCVLSRPEYENTFIHYTMDKEHELIDMAILRIYGIDARFRFSARIDVMSDGTIWEIKCTTQLSTDHFIQVVIYAWLWRTIHPESEKIFRIINIKTGEIWRLDTTMEELDIMFSKILKGKYGMPTKVDDTSFVSNCLE